MPPPLGRPAFAWLKKNYYRHTGWEWGAIMTTEAALEGRVRTILRGRCHNKLGSPPRPGVPAEPERKMAEVTVAAFRGTRGNLNGRLPGPWTEALC